MTQPWRSLHASSMPTREKMKQSGTYGGSTKVISFENTVNFFPDKWFSRWMEKAIHLGAGHFIRVVSPTSACTLIMTIWNIFHDAQLDDGNIKFNALEAELGGHNSYTDTNSANEVNDEVDLLLVTLLVNLSHSSNRSVHTIMCWHRSSDLLITSGHGLLMPVLQAGRFFELKLMQWIHTWWASSTTSLRGCWFCRRLAH